MITIIIPNYNCSDYIGKCINSVKVQTYKDWECIIVDDGSTDGSRKRISDSIYHDGRFTFIPKTRNEGLPSARNTGMEWAKGDILFFLDSDDYIERNCLAVLMNEYDNHPECGRIIGMTMCFDPKGYCWPYTIDIRGYHTSESPHPFTPQCDVGHATAGLYIRENLPEIKFPNVRCFEDMIMNMGLLMAGSSLHITNKYIYKYLWRGNSLVHTYQTQEQAQAERDALQELIRKYNPPKEMNERFTIFLENAIKGRTI